ncbi:DUF7344 domain-containing protein [Salinigranum sp. GCM10025319]|uniref:DUF7344 domain-containing protein n=1 Tax=Salinigranum sp. GCM10025319 TaxID=3252687 RepID=UPI00360D475F
MSTGTSVGGNPDVTTDGTQGGNQSGDVDEQHTTTTAEQLTGEEKITDGDVFEVLSNERRRYALHYLMQHPDDPVEMGDLSTQVAAWEVGVDPAEVTYDQRKSVHTSLYQYHAPKLDETGIVEYDSRGGVVELTAEGSDLDLYLEAVRGREIPWASYFLLLSVFATGLVSAAWLDAPLISGLPDAACAGFIVAMFLVSSLVFAYDNRTAMRLGSTGAPPEVSEE